MTEFVRTGNLLEADVDAIVNTVNTKGVMGKGIALQFKRAFGEMFVTETEDLQWPLVGKLRHRRHLALQNGWATLG